MVGRDVVLARLTRSHVHIAHISTAGGIEAVRRAREQGLNVTCEVTPHHIALEDEAVQSFSTNLKVNPPLRSHEHREAVLEAIADGTIDMIATDHAPHHFDEKNVEFDVAPFGVIGLETAFGVCHEHLVRRGVIELPRLVDLMSCAPARVFGLPGGTLGQGTPGDVTLLDLEARYQVTNTFHSKAANSPFIGETLHGRPVLTIVGGEVRFDARASAAAAAKAKKRVRR
jgi:dihydroorotase